MGSKGDDKGICCTYADHRLHESYKPCMFPFSFKNHTFNTCIVTKRDGPICPTSNQHDDWYIKFTYGTCDQGVCKNFKRGNSRDISNQFMPRCNLKIDCNHLNIFISCFCIDFFRGRLTFENNYKSKPYTNNS